MFSPPITIISVKVFRVRAIHSVAHMHAHTHKHCTHTYTRTHTLAHYTHNIAWFVHVYIHMLLSSVFFSQYINELTINVAMCEDKGPRSKQELASRWAVLYLKHGNAQPVYTSASNTSPLVSCLLDSLYFPWVVFGGFLKLNSPTSSQQWMVVGKVVMTHMLFRAHKGIQLELSTVLVQWIQTPLSLTPRFVIHRKKS